MQPISRYVIENPYEARLTAELPEYKDGKTRRRERRKEEQKKRK